MTDSHTSQPVVVRRDDVAVVDRGSGIRTLPLVGRWNGSTSITNGVTEFQAGTAVARHSHNVDESVTILEGKAVCEVEGVEHALGPGDTSFVPAGLAHCFRNVGNDLLKIHWTYAGVDVTRTFPDTGETVQHLSPEDVSQPNRKSG